MCSIWIYARVWYGHVCVYGRECGIDVCVCVCVRVAMCGRLSIGVYVCAVSMRACAYALTRAMDASIVPYKHRSVQNHNVCTCVRSFGCLGESLCLKRHCTNENHLQNDPYAKLIAHIVTRVCACSVYQSTCHCVRVNTDACCSQLGDGTYLRHT